ncbi:hypothetical protein ABZY58_00100 [Micromonospora tulbaghiae]|uniref:hypothetical protein n=1 Tax=Micromonospora tulbaghiae TaxID=479978 RepID=UPI0033A7F18D
MLARDLEWERQRYVLDLLMRLVQMEGTKDTESRTLLSSLSARNCSSRDGRRSQHGAASRTGPTQRLTSNTIVVSQRAARPSPNSPPGPAAHQQTVTDSCGRERKTSSPKQRSTSGAPDVHIADDHGTCREAIKAAANVSAGHGLDREVRPKGLEPLTF